MDRNILLASLLQQYFFITLFRACAESQASEHASRLTSMQSAQKNLDEKRKELSAQFRRVRQEAITTELLDVLSGFDSIVAHN
jgi:F-type H+-transporting ATPase subunit gamma